MPLLYGVILSCWKGILSILMMTLGFVLAMYGRNIFVILTGPFVYSILENYILSILRLEQYRLVVAFDPTSISDDAVSVMSFLVGPAILIIVILLSVFFPFKGQKKRRREHLGVAYDCSDEEKISAYGDMEKPPPYLSAACSFPWERGSTA